MSIVTACICVTGYAEITPMAVNDVLNRVLVVSIYP